MLPVGWNVLGGVAWAVSITLLGVWLGHVEFIAKNIDILSVLIVAASVIPIGLEIWRRRRKAAQPDPVPVHADED